MIILHDSHFVNYFFLLIVRLFNNSAFCHIIFCLFLYVWRIFLFRKNNFSTFSLLCLHIPMSFQISRFLHRKKEAACFHSTASSPYYIFNDLLFSQAILDSFGNGCQSFVLVLAVTDQSDLCSALDSGCHNV